ncbi:MAG: signal peptidase I [Eubacteriales bacterium]
MVFRKEIRIIVSLMIIFTHHVFAAYLLNNSTQKLVADFVFWSLMGLVFFANKSVRAHGKLKHKGYYMIWMFVAGVLYMLSYFASGFVDGFGKTLFDISFRGVTLNILHLGTVIFFKEYIRYHLINTVQKKFSLYFGIAIVLVYSMMDINLVSLISQKGAENIIIFLCSFVFPVIAYNAFLTLGSYLAGFGATAIYALAVKVPLWILPILPNPQWITLMLIGTCIPIIGMIVLSNTHRSKSTRGRKRMDKEENPYSLLLVATLVVAMVWFALRIFPIYPTVIASNSMYPEISRGDMVIAKKESYDELQVDDIIEYQLENIRVVHRIVEIQNLDGDIFLVTKGDANHIEDAFMVARGQYLGTVKTIIPYLGYPSLLFSTTIEQDLVETGDDASN